MDQPSTTSSAQELVMNAPPQQSVGKRKRSLSETTTHRPPPHPNPSKAHGAHLQINYLARLNSEHLPLVSEQETLPGALVLIDRYEEVLQRQESMAANLGAKPLAQILVKRFERMFDGPVKILQASARNGASVNWLDVVDFARTKPQEFVLNQTRGGAPVCQFWTKGSKVEISEDDFALVASGMPRKMIPPQPIEEDEAKEQATLEILEKELAKVIQLTDAVSGKARQLKYRLSVRRTAIASRRAAKTLTSFNEAEEISGRAANKMNGSSDMSRTDSRSPASPTAGFIAVNARPDSHDPSAREMGGAFHFSNTSGRVNPSSREAVAQRSMATESNQELKAELMKKFTSSTLDAAALKRPSSSNSHKKHPSLTEYRLPVTQSKSVTPSNRRGSGDTDYGFTPHHPGTPGSLPPHSKASPVHEKDEGPFRQEMAKRVEQLSRYDSIYPPCDRCRRLSINCTKNLTACQGCTKKHAKCSWKEVTEDEMLSKEDEHSEENEGVKNADSGAEKEGPPADFKKELVSSVSSNGPPIPSTLQLTVDTASAESGNDSAHVSPESEMEVEMGKD